LRRVDRVRAGRAVVLRGGDLHAEQDRGGVLEELAVRTEVEGLAAEAAELAGRANPGAGKVELVRAQILSRALLDRRAVGVGGRNRASGDEGKGAKGKNRKDLHDILQELQS